MRAGEKKPLAIWIHMKYFLIRIKNKNSGKKTDHNAHTLTYTSLILWKHELKRASVRLVDRQKNHPDSSVHLSHPRRTAI